MHLAITLELPEHHLAGVQRPERLDHPLAGGLQVGRVERLRRLHGHLGGHLEEVCDQHVEDRAGGVVEPGPVRDSERLGNVDLDGRDVVAVPHRTDHLVGEPQHVQLLRRLLAEEVVDPIDLLLGQHGVHQAVELAELLGRRAEGLLEHDPGAVGEAVRTQGLRELRERHRRDRQVVHELSVLAQRGPRLVDHLEQAARVVRLEAATGEPQPVGELVETGRVAEHPAHVPAEVLVRDVAAAVADQNPVLRQQLFLGELVERRQHHPAGQVAGRAEEHEHRGSHARQFSRRRHPSHGM